MKLKKMIFMLLITMLIVSASGCSDTSKSAASDSASVDSGKSEAVKEDQSTEDEKKDWPDHIVIVQMPNEVNPDSGQKHEGFRQAAEEYIGIKVEELEGTDYAVGIEAMKSGKLDVMIVTPMSYYQAKKVAGAEPLVTTTTMGATPYKTVFVTKADRKDINSLEDLKDKTFAFVDPASSSGYMFPKAELIKSLQLEADQLENPGYFFKTVAYSGKHDSSIMGVAMGDYDGAAVAAQTIERIVEAGLIKEGDLKVIGETDVIPNACFVIRESLPQSLKNKIKEFYLQYDDPSYFETFYDSPDAKFIEAKDSDYKVIDEMVKLLKIEE